MARKRYDKPKSGKAKVSAREAKKLQRQYGTPDRRLTKPELGDKRKVEKTMPGARGKASRRVMISWWRYNAKAAQEKGQPKAWRLPLLGPREERNRRRGQ